MNQSTEKTPQLSKVLVVGAGLAGSEAAYFLAKNNIPVVLVESKRIQKNEAQKSDQFAELVCTNSLKSMDPSSAHGLLKTEMKAFDSLVLEAAQHSQVPAGQALTVDREKFGKYITEKLTAHELIEIVDEVVDNPTWYLSKYGCSHCIIATGPLTHDGLTKWIQTKLAGDDFYFYDAIAPVVDADSLDYSKLYFKDRYKDISEGGDYLNAPMNEEEYYNFIEALVQAEKVQAKDFEDYKFFEACLPIDVMAERGRDTARFSCMKPVGLETPNGDRPYAVIQLRKENLLGDAFNMVGFQTRLKYPEQKRVFRMIPGFENAEFVHLGSVHRNSFINSPKLLNFDMSSKKYPWLSFAGQISGVEGYTESAAMGLYVAFQVIRKIQGKESLRFPVETSLGAMVNYLMTSEKLSPSNINFGLMPTVALNKSQRRSKDRKKIKKQLVAAKAREVFTEFSQTF